MRQNDIILLALAVLPVIVLAIFIYRKDKFDKEPLGMLVKAFFFGCLSVIPAIFLESILTSVYTIFLDWLPPFVSGIYNGYVVAGCSEELCKLLLLTIAVWGSRHFDEYFDGVVYAAFVSLGFAGCENIMYVFNQESFSTAFMTGSMRAILSVPAHFLFAVVMGYYFALAKFEPRHRAANYFKAFFLPMLLHGTFDALLMVPEAMGSEGSLLSGILFVVFIYFDVRLWKVGMRKLNNLQWFSEQQRIQQDSERWNTGYGASNSGAYDNGSYNSGTYDNDQDNTSQGSNYTQGSNDPFSGFNWNV